MARLGRQQLTCFPVSLAELQLAKVHIPAAAAASAPSYDAFELSQLAPWRYLRGKSKRIRQLLPWKQLWCKSQRIRQLLRWQQLRRESQRIRSRGLARQRLQQYLSRVGACDCVLGREVSVPREPSQTNQPRSERPRRHSKAAQCVVQEPGSQGIHQADPMVGGDGECLRPIQEIRCGPRASSHCVPNLPVHNKEEHNARPTRRARQIGY